MTEESRRQLALEVALLAVHFGWSEGEILDLPVERRRTYVEVLSEPFGGSLEEALKTGVLNRVESENILRRHVIGRLKGNQE